MSTTSDELARIRRALERIANALEARTPTPYPQPHPAPMPQYPGPYPQPSGPGPYWWQNPVTSKTEPQAPVTASDIPARAEAPDIPEFGKPYRLDVAGT